MPAHIGTFGVCSTAQADTKANPKRANFANPLDNGNLLKTLRAFLEYFQNSFYIFDTNRQNIYVQNG